MDTLYICTACGWKGSTGVTHFANKWSCPKCLADYDMFPTVGDNESAPGSVLLEAKDHVTGDRQEAYGAPKDNFSRWAALCKASGRTSVQHLSPADIAFIMVLGKISREACSHKRDNQVDAAAYLDLYEHLHA